jgi:UDP-glucuronate decarboxylase
VLLYAWNSETTIVKNRLGIIYSDAHKVIEAVDFSWLEGKSVLVTGATGQIGTHFLATLGLLKNDGMKIKAYGYCHSEPEDHTKEIACLDDIQLLSEQNVFTDLDAVIHLAGYAQPSRFTKNPAETIRINVEWTRQLLQYLKPGGKFLFASSSEVYSGLSNADEYQIGTTNPYHPRAGYIEGKRCGEAVVNAFRETGVVDAQSARLSLVYGPGARRGDSRAVSTFIDQSLKDGVVAMKFSGDELRTFCYIRDAVEIMWNILLHGTKAVYNVGSPNSYTIENVACEIARLSGSRLFTGSNQMAGASGNVVMDVWRVMNEFKKAHFVGLEEGLRNTIEWHKGGL